MARKAAAGSNRDLTLKITLLDSKPPIWRRVVVPETMSLADLHNVIQAVMGWEDSHLHQFEIGERRYARPGMLDDTLAEGRVTLKSIRAAGTKRFRYTYDFGDSWEHLIEIEDKPAAALSRPVPLCVAGKRAAPPDDSGGIWGYEEKVEILANPEHEDYDEISEWMPEGFDPEHFSVDECNAELERRFGRGKRSSST
ncbi:MAG TPA: plasmid pRiA4b ORF-3 family protein [Rhodopila sp.]|nr:plasmid pRiA4b ORF-3 family protein [Rhodopila sp.]